MNHQKMEKQLILHEGLELTPYQDTEGFWTIGTGYNLSSRGVEQLEQAIGRQVWDRGPEPEDPFDSANPSRPQEIDIRGIVLTKAEALKMLRVDITRIEKVVKMRLPHYTDLKDVRQRVMVDMAFNMGNRALQFRKALKHLRREVRGEWSPNWSGVGREMFNSKWANQVGDGPGGRMDRAERLVQMILTGEDYTS